jgi:hypothetical protein
MAEPCGSERKVDSALQTGDKKRKHNNDSPREKGGERGETGGRKGERERRKREGIN